MCNRRSGSLPRSAAPIVDTTDGAARCGVITTTKSFASPAENYKQCLSWAEDYGVIINIETHGPYTTNADFLMRLFRHFDSPISDSTSTRATRISRGTIRWSTSAFPHVPRHCHVKDVARDWRPMRGEETGIASSEVPLGGGSNAENIQKCVHYLKTRLERRALDRVPRLRPEHSPERRIPPGATHLISRQRVSRAMAPAAPGDLPSKGESTCPPSSWRPCRRSLAALLPGTDQPAPVRVLLVTGVDHPAHNWKATAPALSNLLEEDGRCVVRIVEDPDVLATDAVFNYDVVLLHFRNEKPLPHESQARANLERLVKEGRGLVLIHFACGAFGDWPGFGELAGMVWDGKNTHDPAGRSTSTLLIRVIQSPPA